MVTEKGIDPLLVAYVVVFSAAALVCFWAVRRARRIEDPDTRTGMVALLLMSGGWATAHVLFLLVPTPGLKAVVYTIGLVIGFAAVGPWLYFCSAYSGRSLHRDPTIRRLAVLVFLAVIAVKVTNPIHGLYYTTAMVTTPFPHLAVQNGLFHWLVMGLSYALATVGYFMLFELFMQVSYDTKPLAALILVTGLPIVLDVIGLASPFLIDITYEPLGVAVFAVGIFYAYRHRFQAVQLAGGEDEPVIVLSDEAAIRDYNDSAAELFPDRLTTAAIGRPVDAVLPEVADAMDGQTGVIELERNGVSRYYRLTNNPFGAGQSRLGGLLTLTDITHREQYRRELERQNERLADFADMISHDLRNPLNVADGHLDLARQEFESDNLEAAATAIDRMEELIDDLLTLARQGQPIDDPEPVSLETVVDRCREVIDTGEAEIQSDGTLDFLADPERLQQLLENLFRNAIDHGGSAVRIRVGPLPDADGFYVADDGPGIPDDERSTVFDSGYTTDPDGTGFGLAIVEEIVDAHGWSIRIAESESGGARFEIAGVTLA